MNFKQIVTYLIVAFAFAGFSKAQNGNIIKIKGKITDSRDSKTYNTITLKSGNHKTVHWFTENLKFKSSDNISLPYAHKDSLGDIFGIFYEHNNPAKLCPKGWHVATEKDWYTLLEIFGDEKTAAKILKSSSQLYENQNGTNCSGLNLQPLGSGVSGCGWSFDTDNSRAVFLVYDKNNETKKIISFLSDDEIIFEEAENDDLYTCRCVKD